MYGRVRQRNADRVTKAPGGATSQAEKVGYVPRARAAPVASGLVSAGMSRSKAPDQGIACATDLYLYLCCIGVVFL